MTPINIQLSSSSGSGDWIIPAMLIWSVIWLFVLATVLHRKDIDPVTKLTWVVVVIFIPIFGVILYWVIAPSSVKNIDPNNQLSGTPWENDPVYSAKSK